MLAPATLGAPILVRAPYSSLIVLGAAGLEPAAAELKAQCSTL